MSTSSRVPDNLPRCPCFADEESAMRKCGDVALAGQLVAAAFQVAARDHGLCAEALPHLVDSMLVTILACVVRHRGPAIEFGSLEMQWESERLVSGMEGRVLTVIRESYDAAREAGLTEEIAIALRERAIRGEQS